MRLPPFAYHAPESLQEVIDIKGDLGSAAAILAGGTDLVVQLKQRLLSPAAVISLKNVQEIKTISEHPDALTIGSGCSLIQVAEHPVVRTHFPVLATAIRSIGAIGIQHYRGTIGGNICLWPRCNLYNQSRFWRVGKGLCHRTGGKECHALPGSESCQSVCSGDAVPVLLALSAQANIAGSSGTRMIPFTEFFTGKGESPFNLTADEILTGIRIPLPWGPISASYQRLAERSAVDYPIVNAAAVAIMDKGRIDTFRLVLSATGPAPTVLKEVEQTVKGNAPDPEMVTQASEAAVRAAEGTIVENSSSPKDYRIRMAGVVAGRAVEKALGL